MRNALSGPLSLPAPPFASHGLSGSRWSAHENFHHTNPAITAGTAKITRKIGSSSATEYPARATPIHRLTRAITNQIGRKTLAAVTVGPGAGPPIKRAPS